MNKAIQIIILLLLSVSINAQDLISRQASPLRHPESLDIDDIEYKSFSFIGADNSDTRAVDLGLSVKWAICNVGAITPDDEGSLYAWGETTYHVKEYRWGSSGHITKYCTDSSLGIKDDKTTLDLADDAAHVNWGGKWRMPTETEWIELRNECSWKPVMSDSILVGYNIYGKNGNSIYLPVAKKYSDDVEFYGSYWSSTLDASDSRNAYSINLSAYNDSIEIYGNSRYDERRIRAVWH